MKRFLALTSLLLVTVAMAADKTTVAGLVKDARLNGKVVAVTGTVAKFQAKTSRSGGKYFTFDLTDKKDHVAVYGKGELKVAPKNGMKVIVTGLFAKERKVGTRTFKNEIDVTSKGKDKNGVSLLPGKSKT